MGKEGGLGIVAELVVGVTDSEPEGRSPVDVSEVGFVVRSWRGRFGSGVGEVGSLCRLRPRMVGLAIAK